MASDSHSYTEGRDILGHPGFQPIVLGADTLGYSYAREFADCYGITTKVLAPVAIKYTQTSRFTDYEVIPTIGGESAIIEWCHDHAGDFGSDKPLIIGGASDAHARTLSQHKEELESWGYAVPYTDFDVLDRVTQKDRFYGICETLGMEYPKTWLLPIGDADEKGSCGDNANLPRISRKDIDTLDYPVIAKPSNSAAWYHAMLKDRHKVYIVKDSEQMAAILDDVEQSGYSRYLVIQEMLDDSDDALYTLTLFSDKGMGEGGETAFPVAVSGHVLVQDRSATGIGNPLAIMGESHPELLEQAKKFLTHVGYEGYANFDVMRDAKTGELKFLEVNTRPGRNTYYVTLAGCHFVKPIVEQFVRHHDVSKVLADEIPDGREFMFSMLPLSVVRKELKGRPAYADAMRLFSEGKWGNPLMNREDCLEQRFWAWVNYEHMRTKF